MDDDFADWAASGLGSARAARLSQLAQRVGPLVEFTAGAWTVDVILVTLDRAATRRLESLARRRHETWVYTQTADGHTVLAIDQPSEAGVTEPAAAISFPETHTRLVSWWLVHAWRSLDLAEDTIRALGRWRVASAVVTARALIEEAGCLLDESLQLAEAWQTGKILPEDPIDRPSQIRSLFHPVLTRAGLGSRIAETPEALRATNVLTYVQKLARATGEARFTTWYDWLSDAAHPAFGARVAYASPPMVHASRAVMTRWYARSPLTLHDPAGATTDLDNQLAHYAADASLASGAVVCDLLDQALLLVDDFGLTTGAARLTNRRYWRNLIPVRGSRPCPCGRGSWATCQHRWGQPAPRIEPPTGGPMWPQTAGAET